METIVKKGADDIINNIIKDTLGIIGRLFVVLVKLLLLMMMIFFIIFGVVDIVFSANITLVFIAVDVMAISIH